MAGTGTRPSPDGPGAVGLAAWRAGWRSALRLARRDIARHRGRALLIVLLVGLPVLLISSLATAVATDDVNHVEALPRLMGRAQASVPLGLTSRRQVQQDQYLNGFAEGSGAALREPGVTKDAPWTPERLQRLTGGRVLTATTGMARAVVGDGGIDAHVLGLDGRVPATRGKVELGSGRWPRSDDEVLVTSAGAAAGLPTHGTLTLRSRYGGAVTVTVVGRGAAWGTDTSHADVVALPSAVASWHIDADPVDLLVVRDRPVTWTDVKALNRHGLYVLSRDVVEHPGQAQPDVDRVGMGTSSPVAALAVLLVLGIILETTLLAGPAFAVSAARQRRSLALIAANGAPKAQVRRYVLAQAVLLGGGAAAVGAALGIGGGLLVDRVWQQSRWAVNAAGPVDIPLWEVLGIAAVAALASLVAAYLPARGATRLDLVDVLRGRGVTPRKVHAGMPIAGLVIASLGGVLLAANLITHGREWGIATGGIVLFAGALMLVPWLLSMVGRLGGRLPLPLRIAARDTGRQRGRSAPAVAAIMAAVTALTALAIGGFSDNEQSRQQYQQQDVMGQGHVSGDGPGWVKDVTQRIRESAPGLAVEPHRIVGSQPAEGTRGQRWTTTVRVRVHGCSRSQTLAPDDKGPLRCRVLGSDAPDDHTWIRVATPAQAAQLLRLSTAEQQVLADGGLLVSSDKRVLTRGKVTILQGRQRLDPSEGYPLGAVRSVTVARLPAQALADARFRDAMPAGHVAAVIAPATARALHWPTWTEQVDVRNPGGTISADQQTAIEQQLSPDEYLYVERGFRSEAFYVFLALFVLFGLLVLVATLISTALAQAEARPDLATLAAVGAGRGLRRAVAASQAFVVGLVGSLLGLVVGFVPGIAVTWPLTANAPGAGTQVVIDGALVTTGAGPTIVIPWLPLAAVVIGVPVLAALLAAVGIRKAPEVTRRPG